MSIATLIKRLIVWSLFLIGILSISGKIFYFGINRFAKSFGGTVSLKEYKVGKNYKEAVFSGFSFDLNDGAGRVSVASIDVSQNISLWWKTGRGFLIITVNDLDLKVFRHKKFLKWIILLKKKLSGGGLFFSFVRFIELVGVSWDAITPRGNFVGNLSGSCEARKDKKGAIIRFSTGELLVDGKEVVSSIKGHLIYNKKNRGDDELCFSQKVVCRRCPTTEEVFHITGSWGPASGSLHCGSMNSEKLRIKIKKDEDGVYLDSKCSLCWVNSLLGTEKRPCGFVRATGSSRSLWGLLNKSKWMLKSETPFISQGRKIFNDAAVRIDVDGKKIEARALLNLPIVGRIVGASSLDLNSLVSKFELVSRDKFDLGEPLKLFIDSGGAIVQGAIDSKFNVSGNYNLTLKSDTSIVSKNNCDKQNVYKNLLGEFFVKDESIFFDGKDANRLLTGNVSLKDKQGSLVVANNGVKECSISCDEEQSLLKSEATIRFLKSILPPNISKGWVGKKGTLNFELGQAGSREFFGKFFLKDANLMSDGGCNPIKSLSGDFNFSSNEKSLKISEVNAKFEHGKLFIPELICKFSDKKEVEWLHSPILIEDLLVNQSSDFYSIISASIQLSKINTEPLKLRGNVLMKKSLYQGNGFSKETRPSFLEVERALGKGAGVFVDLAFETVEPMKISSGTLNSFAGMNMRMKGLFYEKNPHNINLSGDVNFRGGTVLLMDKIFSIAHGHMHFQPHRSYDPFIDVVARGDVRGFSLKLDLHGSLQNPNMLWTSDPELSGERILSLLLSGAKDNDLENNLKDFVMNKVTSIISGDDLQKERLNKLITAVSKPLGKLKLFPYSVDHDFSKVEASVDIDVMPSLYASIKKTSSSHDSLSLGLEHSLAKNLGLKLGRDSSGNVEGKLEVKLKF
jgi:hypothetical protein